MCTRRLRKRKEKLLVSQFFLFQWEKKHRKERRKSRKKENEKKKENYWKIYENGKKMKIRQYFVSNGVCVAADGNS